MKYLKALITVLIIGQLSLCISGCGKPKESLPEDKVIARINDYTMTAEDFRGSARSIGGTKEETLEELITRNILLQEAQKQNFDKDRVFMKEIERYWEQALLKLLIKKKMAEFSNVFNGDKKKVENAMDKWIKDLRARANVKVYKDNLSRTELP